MPDDLIRPPFNHPGGGQALPPGSHSDPDEIERLWREIHAEWRRAKASPEGLSPEKDAEMRDALKMLRKIFVRQTRQLPGPRAKQAAIPPVQPSAQHASMPPSGDQIRVEKIDAVISNAGGTLSAGNVTAGNHVEATNYIQHQSIYQGGTGPLIEEEAMVQAYLGRLYRAASLVSLGQMAIQPVDRQSEPQELQLEEIYIPLETTRTRKAGRGAEASEPLSALSALDALNSYRRLVILGDPGSGKSTLLNYLTLCLAGAGLYPERRVEFLAHIGMQPGKEGEPPILPLRVELREFAASLGSDASTGSAKQLLDYLADHFESAGQPDFLALLRRELSAGRCLLLFDGLDEVGNTRLRRLVRESLLDFGEAYNGCRMVVTCRGLSYADPDGRLTGFQAVSLAPLGEDAIRDFIDRWYQTLEALGQFSSEEARARTRDLHLAITGLGDMASNPMLLTVVALVHTSYGELHHSRVRLYQDCIQLLLWEWQRQKKTANGGHEAGIDKILGIRHERLINGLAQVAYEAHWAGGSGEDPALIAEGELMFVLKSYLGSYDKAQVFCQYVEQRAGLLLGKGQGQRKERMYAFAHRGFQEFLAAQHLIEMREFGGKAHSMAQRPDQWIEVVRLAAGHMVHNQNSTRTPLDTVNLLCPLETPASDTDWRLAWWAAEFLAVVGPEAAATDPIGQKVLPLVTRQVAALIEGGKLTARERSAAADALALIGDPRPGVIDPLLHPERDMPRFSPAKKAAFSLARTMVTNAQFRAFAHEGYRVDRFWSPRGLEWRKRSQHHGGFLADLRFGLANRPVVGISWYEAEAYAAWLAYRTGRPFRLPSEAEWTYAAGGESGQRYPYGERGADQTANLRECGLGQTCAVGIFPADRTPEGLLDMGGNAWEWTSTASESGGRVLKSGSYDTPRTQARISDQHSADPAAFVPLAGFRLAMG